MPEVTFQTKVQLVFLLLKFLFGCLLTLTFIYLLAQKEQQLRELWITLLTCTVNYTLGISFKGYKKVGSVTSPILDLDDIDGCKKPLQNEVAGSTRSS